VALPAAVAVLSLFAASAAAKTRTYTAQYRGEYRLMMDTADAHGDDSQHLLQTFSWTERVFTEVPDGGVSTSRVTLHAQGTLIQTGEGPNSARLAPSGITAAELHPVAGGAFNPGSVDLLARLAH
jgi:hypothetical protein